MGQKPTLNTLHGSQFRLSLSNLPWYPISKVDKFQVIDMQMYSLFYKSITLPDIRTEYNIDTRNGVSRKFPIPHYNKQFPEFQIEFMVNESMENYLRMFFWHIGLHFGYPADGKTTQTDSVIHIITCELLDNESRAISKIEFTDCVTTNLSNLTLRQGDSSELTFSASFWPTQINYDYIAQS